MTSMPLGRWAVAVATMGLSTFAEQEARGDDLDFMLLPTVQYAHGDIYWRTPSGHDPSFSAASAIAVGQRLDILVLARGWAVDAKGEADVVYDLLVHRPDGSTMEKVVSLEIAVGDKVEPGTVLYPRRVASFSTDAEDQTGVYRFAVTVHDRVRGCAMTKVATVRVGGALEVLPLPEDFDPIRWMATYYIKPAPQLALPALTALSRNPDVMKRPASGHGALLGFYEQVLTDNRWLLPHIKVYLPTVTDNAERHLLTIVLSYALRDEPGFAERLPEEMRNLMPTASKEPMSGAQLDLLWGRFLAGGRFEPVADLVAVVEAYLPHRGKFEEFKRLEHKPNSMPPEVRRDVILGTAMWSLGSNAQQHKRVRDYLTGMLQAPDTGEAMKLVLAEILSPNPPARMGATR